MSRAYYYLIASLPLLEFDRKPPISLAGFRAECQEQITPTDFQTIEEALLWNDEDHILPNFFVKQWIDFNHQLQNELVWVRALERDKDPSLYIRGERTQEFAFLDVAAQAIKIGDPLEAEKFLDRIRWQKIDELTKEHYFDLEKLIAYALKLQILERYQEIESPKGKELFKEYQKFDIPVIQ